MGKKLGMDLVHAKSRVFLYLGPYLAPLLFCVLYRQSHLMNGQTWASICMLPNFTKKTLIPLREG
jgi:hypothetical protein